MVLVIRLNMMDDIMITGFKIKFRPSIIIPNPNEIHMY